MTTYHDLHIETADIPRTSVFNLPFTLLVSCTRAAGWQLCSYSPGSKDYVPIAGEYGEKGLRLDVAGHVIVDSLTPRSPDEAAP